MTKTTVRWTFYSVAILFAFVAIIWLLPPYLAESEIYCHGTLSDVAAIKPETYALVINEYRKTVAQALGGFGVIATLFLSVITLQMNERAKIADRFGKALDHLGAIRRREDQIASEVRIGAVSELEGIGQESGREQRMIQSSFAAYLRNYAHWPAAMRDKDEPAVWRLKEIEAMLGVLAKWGIPAENNDDLRMTDLDLRNLRLPPKANLSEIMADRSCFDYANLEGAIFRRGSFDGCTFRGAKLARTDLRGASLTNSTLIGTPSGTDNWGWSSAGQFTWDGESVDADLRGADLRGADLSSCTMTSSQFQSAITDKTTIRPKSFFEKSRP